MRLDRKLVTLVLLATLSFACSDDERTEYPGNLIKHGAFNIVMPGSDINDSNLRIKAESYSTKIDLSSLPGTDWTYELWIKVDPDALVGNKDARNGLFAGGACFGSRRHIFELYLINDFFGDEADYAIKYGKLRSGDDDQAASMQSDESTVSLLFDTWVHVAISRSSTDSIARFYINGVLIDSSSEDLWKHPENSDVWLDFNSMFRGSSMHFFKGSMDNIRLSTTNRYPDEFTVPDRTTAFHVDEYTLLQLNLEQKLSPFDPVNDFDKLKVSGAYEYYIRAHKGNTWFQEPDEYLPLGDY